MPAPVAAATPSPPLVPLGHTGLLVSAIGLGLAGLGRPAYMTFDRDADLGGDRTVAAMRRRCHSMLDAAYAAGVRYVDAARSYGLAEQFVRTWCDDRRLGEHALTIGSKWGYQYIGGWRLDATVHEVKSLSAGALRAQLAQTRAMLGSRLSLYQIHSATLESGVLEDRAVIAELLRLRECGTCVGLTVTGPRQPEMIRAALDVRGDGVPIFQTVQATWNLLEPSAGAALAEAHAAGCGVIVKEVLANGRLTTRRAAADRMRAVMDHAAHAGCTVETLAIAAALQQPWADVVLSGALTPAQLHAALAALDVAGESAAAPIIAEPAESYWRRRAAVPWS